MPTSAREASTGAADTRACPELNKMYVSLRGSGWRVPQRPAAVRTAVRSSKELERDDDSKKGHRALIAPQQRSQSADVRKRFDRENGLNELRGPFASEDRRGEVDGFVGNLSARHRVARRTAHRRDALRENRSV